MTIPGRGVYGLTESTATAPALWGGYAEYMYLEPNAAVHRVPEGVPPEIAALYVPLSNGVRWTAYVPGLEQGDIVVVMGPGQQGLGCVVAAREAGASMVIVTGTAADAQRLEVAKASGRRRRPSMSTMRIRSTRWPRRPVVAWPMSSIDVSAESTAPRRSGARHGAPPAARSCSPASRATHTVPGFVSDKIVLRGLTIHGSSSPRGNRNNDADKPIRKALEIMARGGTRSSGCARTASRSPTPTEPCASWGARSPARMESTSRSLPDLLRRVTRPAAQAADQRSRSVAIFSASS